MTLRAALVLGSNTFRLLIADCGQGGAGETALRSRSVRAGEGELAPALERATPVLEEFARALAEAGNPPLTAALTAVGRDPVRGKPLAKLAAKILGHPVSVLTGEEEAALSLAGARAHLPPRVGPELLLDIGGGSTEIVGVKPGAPTLSESLPLGVLTPAGEGKGGWTDLKAGAAERFAESAFAAEIPWWRARFDDRSAHLIANAGTPVTLAALANDLPLGSSRAVNGLVLTLDLINRLAEELRALAPEELAAHPAIAPGRRDLILPGTAILTAFMEAAGASQLTVADGGVCEGLLLSGVKGC